MSYHVPHVEKLEPGLCEKGWSILRTAAHYGMGGSISRVPGTPSGENVVGVRCPVCGSVAYLPARVTLVAEVVRQVTPPTYISCKNPDGAPTTFDDQPPGCGWNMRNPVLEGWHETMEEIAKELDSFSADKVTLVMPKEEALGLLAFLENALFNGGLQGAACTLLDRLRALLVKP